MDSSAPTKDQEDIPTFDEWKKKMLEVEIEKSEAVLTVLAGLSETVLAGLSESVLSETVLSVLSEAVLTVLSETVRQC